MSIFHLGEDGDEVGAHPSDRKADLLTAAWFLAGEDNYASLATAECERIAAVLRDMAREA